MSIPLTQVSWSEAQLSMQVIQATLCHLGLNALLQNAMHSSSKSRIPLKQVTNLHVPIKK